MSTANGTIVFPPVGVATGTVIVGAGANQMLYTNASGKLATTPNATFDGTNLVIGASGEGSITANILSTPGLTIDTNGSITGGDSSELSLLSTNIILGSINGASSNGLSINSGGYNSQADVNLNNSDGSTAFSFGYSQDTSQFYLSDNVSRQFWTVNESSGATTLDQGLIFTSGEGDLAVNGNFTVNATTYLYAGLNNLGYFYSDNSNIYTDGDGHFYCVSLNTGSLTAGGLITAQNGIYAYNASQFDGGLTFTDGNGDFYITNSLRAGNSQLLLILDSSRNACIDPVNRQLFDSSGTTIQLSWSTSGVESHGNFKTDAAVVTSGYQTASPTTGTTVTCTANKPGLALSPSGTLATLTIKLPASPIDGQHYWISSTQTITTVTWQDSGGTAGNVIGGQTTIGGTTRGQTFVYQVAISKWVSIS